MKNTSDKAISTLKELNISRHQKFVCGIAIVLIIAAVLGYHFVTTNEKYYKRTIAKITSISLTAAPKESDNYGHVEPMKVQHIKAVIMNGSHKGQNIELKNKISYSQAYDLHYKVNDEVFVVIKYGKDGKISYSRITDFKRDKYTAYITILFILLIIAVGGLKGFKSLASVVFNVLIFLLVIKLYLIGWSIIAISFIASILFSMVSISIVNGISKKSASAIIGTVAGTILSMLIAIIVMKVTHEKGVYYEGVELPTNEPDKIFLIGVLVGTLGGIMDIAISMSSAISELYDTNPGIERKILTRSAMEIGKDIMGTMANTLVFAYVSGSIPMILLWLKNGYSPYNIFTFNISIEVIRALIGSIGIVISIPITLYISVVFLKKHRIGEV